MPTRTFYHLRNKEDLRLCTWLFYYNSDVLDELVRAVMFRNLGIENCKTTRCAGYMYVVNIWTIEGCFCKLPPPAVTAGGILSLECDFLVNKSVRTAVILSGAWFLTWPFTRGCCKYFFSIHEASVSKHPCISGSDAGDASPEYLDYFRFSRSIFRRVRLAAGLHW